MRRTALFRQSDIERALKAGARVGVAVSVRVEAATGDLVVIPVDPVAMGAPADDLSRMIEAADL